MSKLFLDDELIDSDSVVQPLLSRGFAFGFGVFETMKFLDGAPCFFDEHLQRLRRGVSGAGLNVELDAAVLRSRAYRLFESEGVKEGVFKIVISDTGKSTNLAMFVRTKGIKEELEPSRLLMSEVVKASRAFTSRNKSLNYMESILELEKAQASGFTECVFKNENGNLTECAVANLFFVHDGVLKTPALECGLLDGIVRRKVVGIARGMGISVEEGKFSEKDLLDASEAFLTSSGGGPRSAESFKSLTDQPIDYSVELLPKLREAYLQLEREEALSHRV